MKVVAGQRWVRIYEDGSRSFNVYDGEKWVETLRRLPDPKVLLDKEWLNAQDQERNT